MHPETSISLLRALESDLAILETLQSRFNIFEAVGMTNQEIRHSVFLAFLLHPGQSHGFGDRFLRAFLRRVFASGSQTAETLLLKDVTLLREWNHIDLLIVCPADCLVILIENKIWSGEHDDQLRRYFDIVRARYPAPKWKVLGVYLSPGGTLPSDARYHALPYGAVIEEIERLTTAETPKSESDAAILCRHYVQIMRRHIVGGSEVELLCRRMFRDHAAAIELLLKYQPDTQGFIRKLMESLIEETDGLIVDFAKPSEKRWVTFYPASWQVVTPRTATDGLSPEKRLLVFSLYNVDDELAVYVDLRPGPKEEREAIMEAAKEDNSGLLQITPYPPQPQFVSLYKRVLLPTEDYRSAPKEAQETIIRANWQDFIAEDLPSIATHFAAAMRRLRAADD